MLLERLEDVAPERGLFGYLNLRQVQDKTPPFPQQDLPVVHDIEGGVDDGRRQRATVGRPDVAIVEVQATRAEDPCRGAELRAPVVQRCVDRKTPPPMHSSRRDLLGDCQEPRISSEGKFQVALVVE